MAICSNCNHEIPEGVDRCSACGAEVKRGLLSRLFGGSSKASAPPPASPPPEPMRAPPAATGPSGTVGERVLEVEDVFSISGRGTVVTGKAAAALRVGESVTFCTPSGEERTTTVTGIEMFRKLLDAAKAGDSIGVLLKGVTRADIARGVVLVRAR